jgi:hypothetical protein
MDNPFERILQELGEIKTQLNTLRIPSSEQIEIIDRSELLKRLGITEPTVIRWTKRGLIPEIRIGSNVRYNWMAVVKSLESSKK